MEREDPDTRDHQQSARAVSSGAQVEDQLWSGHHDNTITTVEVVSWAADRAMTGDQDKDKLSQRQSGRTQLGGRVLRNRRYRRPFDDSRQTKRLFTPEIKKFLKDWLVRRRDHPYPNRDEKKRLALQTGLTYIQICNWFANWRRKLKNAGHESRTSWGNLIKNYNTRAHGNVEQFSISSDDSIWEQPGGDVEENQETPRLTYTANATTIDHSYSVIQNRTSESERQDDKLPQCFQVTSTTTEEEDAHSARQAVSLSGVSAGISDDFPMEITTPTHEDLTLRSLGPTSTNKYKSHIMEKYLRDLQLEPSQSDQVETARLERAHPGNTTSKESIPHSSTATVEKDNSCSEQTKSKQDKKSKTIKKTKESCPPLVLSKWLESAAKFRPTKCYIPWSVSKSDAWRQTRCRATPNKSQKLNVAVDEEPTSPKLETGQWGSKGHQREELDAAEALTRLSGLQQ